MNTKGWRGYGPEAGKFVPVEDGFDYAAEQCGIQIVNPSAPETEEFKAMLVEWFFSGNWVEVEEDEDG